MYVYVYWNMMLYTRNWHTVNRLYFNFLKMGGKKQRKQASNQKLYIKKYKITTDSEKDERQEKLPGESRTEQKEGGRRTIKVGMKGSVEQKETLWKLLRQSEAACHVSCVTSHRKLSPAATAPRDKPSQLRLNCLQHSCQLQRIQTPHSPVPMKSPSSPPKNTHLRSFDKC